MFVIIWEYRVKADHVETFEEIYSATGAWTKLFRKSSAYLGTEFLYDVQHAQRYITIDRWISAQDYEDFLSEYQAEYADTDKRCAGLAEQEVLLGKFETNFGETR